MSISVDRPPVAPVPARITGGGPAPAAGPVSGQALAGVVGPLIEVPVLVALVHVSLTLGRRLSWPGAGIRPPGDRVGRER